MNSEFHSILDGCSFCDGPVESGGYSYFRYIRPGGSGVITRISTDETEVRFNCFTSSETDSAWADFASRTYYTPKELKLNR